MALETTSLTSLQKVILTKPTQRFLLWIIANDSKAFSSFFLIEMAKNPELMQPGKAPNLADALVMIQHMKDKGMVDLSDALKTKIKWRGQWYRFYTHPSKSLWIGIAAILTAFIIWLLPNLTNGSKETAVPSSQEAKRNSPPDHSITSNPSPDSSGNHKDTTQKKQ